MRRPGPRTVAARRRPRRPQPLPPLADAANRDPGRGVTSRSHRLQQRHNASRRLHPRPTAVMSLVRPYKERGYAELAASGARQIRPRRDAHDWPVTDDDAETFKEVVLVGATAHEA